MPENVSPEEVEALVGSDQVLTEQAVEVRDFRQPRRLSVIQQRSIRTALTQVLPALEAGLTVWLRSEVTVSLRGLGEASAIGLFDELQDPLGIQTCDVDGKQGWIVWDNDVALRSVTTALGAEIPDELEPRELSPMEVGLTTDILTVFAEHVGEALGLKLVPAVYSQNMRDFLVQHDIDPEGDPQRLFLHLDMESSMGSHTLKVYLPGILPDVAPQRPGALSSMPTHLGAVAVEVCAEFAPVDVALTDLMEIEIGDVIPLDIPVGESVQLRIEGDYAGSARWGQMNGAIAISIQQIESIPEDSP